MVIVKDQSRTLKVQMSKLLLLSLALVHALSRPLSVEEVLLSSFFEEFLVLFFLLLPLLISLLLSFFPLLVIDLALDT